MNSQLDSKLLVFASLFIFSANSYRGQRRLIDDGVTLRVASQPLLRTAR